MSVAKRVSEEVRAGVLEKHKGSGDGLTEGVDDLGGSVVYAIRFEDQTSEQSFSSANNNKKEDQTTTTTKENS